jgi:hypothetical protein
MSHRTELPWDKIGKQVLKAIRDYNEGRRFVSSKRIAEHIHSDPTPYPLFEDCTFQTTQSRVTTVLENKLKWVRYNRKGGKKAGVYINPNIKDEPCVVYAEA